MSAPDKETGGFPLAQFWRANLQGKVVNYFRNSTEKYNYILRPLTFMMN